MFLLKGLGMDSLEVRTAGISWGKATMACAKVLRHKQIQAMSKPKVSKVFLWLSSPYPFGSLASWCFLNLANSFPLQRRPWVAFPQACPVVSLPPTRQPVEGSTPSQHCLRLRMEPLLGWSLQGLQTHRVMFPPGHTVCGCFIPTPSSSGG